MNTLTIKSRKTGETFDFWMPLNGGYIRLGGSILDDQICEGGGFMGSTLSARPVNFEKTCRKWYRQHIARIG